MTLDLETRRMLSRVRDASSPDEERVARLRVVLLAQVAVPLSEAADPGPTPSASLVTGNLTLAKWSLVSLVTGTLVLGGIAAVGPWPSAPPSAVDSSKTTQIPAYDAPTQPSPPAEVAPPSPAPSVLTVTPRRRERAKSSEATETVAAHSDLDAQVELLSRALLALRDLQPAEARRLLQQHAELYPQSPLIPERERALAQLAQLEDAREATEPAEAP